MESMIDFWKETLKNFQFTAYSEEKKGCLCIEQNVSAFFEIGIGRYLLNGALILAYRRGYSDQNVILFTQWYGQYVVWSLDRTNRGLKMLQFQSNFQDGINGYKTCIQMGVRHHGNHNDRMVRKG